MPLSSLVFVVPGDLGSLTGGYAYDRHIIEGLRASGWAVELVSLHGGFPWPDEAALCHAAERIATISDGRLVVVDGLALGTMPDIVELHARRLRWVALVHHPLALETGLTGSQARQLFDSEQRALASVAQVIVTSRSTALALDRYGVPASRIKVVEPGTRLPASAVVALHEDEAEGDGGAEGLSLLCVATVTPRKGHLTLIEALAGLSEKAWTLHCVGSLTRDRDTADAVRTAIRSHGLSGRVHLHGEVDEAQLASLYARAEVFVLPSFHEGYGMVLAEALAQGLPIVSTAVGAIPDTVPGGAALLVPPGDAPALRAALRRLIEEPHLRASLAEGALAAAKRLPSWPQAVSHFAQALRQTPN